MLPAIPLAIGGFLALMALGAGRRPAPVTAKEESEKAKEAGVQAMVVKALESRDKNEIDATIRELTRLGQSKAAKDLARAWGELQELAKSKGKTIRRTVNTTAAASTSAVRGKAAQTKPSAPAQAAPRPGVPVLPETTTQIPNTPATATPAPKEPTVKPLTAAATSALATISRGRYKENREAVKALQLELGVKADGQWGPTSARAFHRAYDRIPPNPLYWPAKDTAKAVNDYKLFLTQIGAPKELIARVGR